MLRNPTWMNHRNEFHKMVNSLNYFLFIDTHVSIPFLILLISFKPNTFNFYLIFYLFLFKNSFSSNNFFLFSCSSKP